MNWKRLLAHITGSVDQELLLGNEYLVTEGGEPQNIGRWPSRVYGLCSDASARGVFVVTDRVSS